MKRRLQPVVRRPSGVVLYYVWYGCENQVPFDRVLIDIGDRGWMVGHVGQGNAGLTIRAGTRVAPAYVGFSKFRIGV